MRREFVVTMLAACLAVVAFAAPGWAEHEMDGSKSLSMPEVASGGGKVRYPFVCSGTTCVLVNEVCQDKAKGILLAKPGEQSAMAGAPMQGKATVMVYKTVGPDDFNMYARQMDIPPCQ
jgi:hypothetical protein